MGNGTFSPSESITREQIAAMFYRYADYTKADLTAKGDLTAFADNNKIADWAQPLYGVVDYGERFDLHEGVQRN